MQNAGVIYASKTGHSKKLADALAQALDVKAENVANSPKLKNLDLLFIVGGIYGGQSSPELLEYIKSLSAQDVKKAALITSCASKKQGQKSVRKLLTEIGIEVIDEFICRGSILFIGMGHPDKKDIESAVDFARRIIGSGQ